MTAVHDRADASPQAAGSPPAARRHFLSWVRDGVSGSIALPDPGSGPLPARAALATGLTVNGVAVTGPDLQVHGPGDVVGLDPRQVVRCEPQPGSGGFEPEHLAAVEFDDPALPWRLTPAAPNPARGLRPWLVLVVVDTATPGVALAPAAGGPLPVLTAPVSALPDLAGSAAWAHAEVTAVDGEDVATLLRTRPERTVSRLLAPTALRPDRNYLACVVPAFAHGVVAGLGGVPTGDTTGPAWSGATGSVTLPVYHSWTFATGADGDFPTLAGKLTPVVPDPGRRTLSYRDADPELTPALGTDPGVATVLPALHPAAATPDAPTSAQWGQAVRGVLSRGATEFVPPVYLAAHLAHGPAWTGDEPAWQVELNSDPRLRAAAGLGARVVRENQEALMAAAWRQAAALAEANRELAAGTLGRAVAQSLHDRYFDTRSGLRGAVPTPSRAAEAGALVVSRGAAALGRVSAEGTGLHGLTATAGTVEGELRSHPATAGVLHPTVQRALRPTGPAARAAGADATAPLSTPVVPVATGALVPAPQLRAAGDAGVLDRVPDSQVRYRGITSARIAGSPAWWQAWASGNRPVMTPGLHGYLADLLTVRQPAPGAAIQLTVRAEFDLDGVPGEPSAPITIPAPAGAPADLTLLGASLVRSTRDTDPELVLVLAQGSDRYAERNHFLRTIRGITPTGFREAGPLLPAGRAPFESGATARVTDYRLSEVTAGVREFALTYVDQLRSELSTVWVADTPQGPDWWFDRRDITLPALWDQENSPYPTAITCEWIPKPFAGAYTPPTDLVVAWLAHSPRYSEDEFPMWSLQYCVVRGASGYSEQVGPMVDLGPVIGRVPEENATGSPRMTLTVTDFDGDGTVEVIANLTAPEAMQVTIPGPVTEAGWSVFPVAVAEIDAATGTRGPGRQRSWSFPATKDDITVVGDTSELRLTRLAAIGDRFKLAAAAHQALLVSPATDSAPPPGAAPYSMAAVADTVSTSLDPETTVPARVLSRVDFGVTGQRSLAAAADPLRPRRFEPVFDQPMMEPMRAAFAELVLPGGDALPADGVALMSGNAPLIAAYLAGLNDEFGRELLWRGFPSTGRATWFRRFFDARGADGGADIRPIAEWGRGDLGSVVTGAGGRDGVTMLVRGPLVRRFPDLVVQAVRAAWGPGGTRVPGSDVLAPSLTGVLGPDTTLFGFPTTAAALRGHAPDDPGWFLCFAEAPTGSRFAGTTAWTGPGGQVAAALVTLPYRVLIHATDLLDPTPGAHA